MNRRTQIRKMLSDMLFSPPSVSVLWDATKIVAVNVRTAEVADAILALDDAPELIDARKKAEAMHRRAQKAEGALYRAQRTVEALRREVVEAVRTRERQNEKRKVQQRRANRWQAEAERLRAAQVEAPSPVTSLQNVQTTQAFTAEQLDRAARAYEEAWGGPVDAMRAALAALAGGD